MSLKLCGSLNQELGQTLLSVILCGSHVGPPCLLSDRSEIHILFDASSCHWRFVIPWCFVIHQCFVIHWIVALGLLDVTEGVAPYPRFATLGNVGIKILILFDASSCPWCFVNHDILYKCFMTCIIHTSALRCLDVSCYIYVSCYMMPHITRWCFKSQYTIDVPWRALYTSMLTMPWCFMIHLCFMIHDASDNSLLLQIAIYYRCSMTCIIHINALRCLDVSCYIYVSWYMMPHINRWCFKHATRTYIST